MHNNAASSLVSTETSPEDEGKKLFVPRKRSKEKKKDDVLTTVVDVLKDMSRQNTVADLQKFFQEENEHAREHEMRIFQLFMSGQGAPTYHLSGPSHMYHPLMGSVIADRSPN